MVDLRLRVVLLSLLVTTSRSQFPMPVGDFQGDDLLLVSRGYDNLYPFGRGTKDAQLYGRELTTGRQVDLFTFFPYYGGRYNYTLISVHGYAAFGNVNEWEQDFAFGNSVENWPQESDPALIAVYACRQKPIRTHEDEQGVHYRVVFRKNMVSSELSGDSPLLPDQFRRKHMPSYVEHDDDDLLDRIQYDLRDGMVGANNFRVDMALIVTWENVTFQQASREDEDSGKTATYQLVFASDRGGQLSYAIINYHKLGYAGSDIQGSARKGRCMAEFNGGNATGSVLVDPVYSKTPMQLAMMSSVPHRVRGRYLFRVDDVVRKGGCSNLTVGTYRLTIYPDIVNSMGDTTVQVNGPCMQITDKPILYVAENKPAYCKVKNAAIAECKMVRYFHWGVKYVYFSVRGIKSYIGSIYYVPSGLDPYALDMGQLDHWYQKTPPPQGLSFLWYADNFTRANFQRTGQLELTVWGYKERRDDRETKFVPTLQKLGRIGGTVPNPTNEKQEIGQFVLNKNVRLSNAEVSDDELLTFRFGFLKLTDVTDNEEGVALWSPPIPVHMFFISDEAALESHAKDECIRWFEEDGQQWNFIRDTETNASCPCRYEQALIDIGRFMPHPRCSQRFRSLHCDTYTGAKECFLTAHNIHGNYVTHYGQVCCYDRDGYLMHTSYQTVVQIENYPYSPGFPQRAFEFGTYPFAKQFELPTLSHYYHDVLPYYFCCKWSQEHCQFFYWRRPSSGCQQYEPPAIGSVFGAGHFVTLDGHNYTTNRDGIYMLLHKPKTESAYMEPQPEVQIQIRLERYPDRTVDFGHRDTYQHMLMQPLNVSVVTGVAIQEGTSMESDRVLVLLRKDTRRYKYRTHILVNDELRYFDTIKTQRFRGVTVYVNDWKEGQCEVFVVLENSKIGVRIKESYSMEVTRQLNYEESFGLLDVLVSVPPDYKLIHRAGERPDYARVLAGLAGTYSTKGSPELIYGSRATSSQMATESFLESWKVDGSQFHSLFNLLTTDHRDWPEAKLIGAVYPVTQRWNHKLPYYTPPGMFEAAYSQCSSRFSAETCPSYDIMKMIGSTCDNVYNCRYDSFYLKQPYLGYLLNQEQLQQKEMRDSGMRLYNSCGAINVEYPDFLFVNPATGKLYLDSNEVQFECYPSHWLKGDAFFRCHDGRWNQGWQPWCRSKQMETTLRVLSIIFGLMLSVLAIAAIFCCCWMRRDDGNKRKPPPAFSGHEKIIKLPPDYDNRQTMPMLENSNYEPPKYTFPLTRVNNQAMRNSNETYLSDRSTMSSPASARGLSPTIGRKTLV